MTLNKHVLPHFKIYILQWTVCMATKEIKKIYIRFSIKRNAHETPMHKLQNKLREFFLLLLLV